VVFIDSLVVLVCVLDDRSIERNRGGIAANGCFAAFREFGMTQCKFSAEVFSTTSKLANSLVKPPQEGDVSGPGTMSEN